MFFAGFISISWKNQNFDLFSKTYYLINISQNLSTFSYYEGIQIKIQKSRLVSHGTEQKTFKFVKSPRGEIRLGT